MKHPVLPDAPLFVYWLSLSLLVVAVVMCFVVVFAIPVDAPEQSCEQSSGCLNSQAGAAAAQRYRTIPRGEYGTNLDRVIGFAPKDGSTKKAITKSYFDLLIEKYS
jgi:hypothetical protein